MAEQRDELRGSVGAYPGRRAISVSPHIGGAVTTCEPPTTAQEITPVQVSLDRVLSELGPRPQVVPDTADPAAAAEPQQPDDDYGAWGQGPRSPGLPSAWTWTLVALIAAAVVYEIVHAIFFR